MFFRIFLKLSQVSIVLALLASQTASANKADGGVSGGGGDKVEPLFYAAQKRAITLINYLDFNKIDALRIPIFYKNWLKENMRLVNFQYYTSSMEFSFQDEPCVDEGRPRGTSFDNSDSRHPRMCVSYSMNQNTTPAQAAALVFHEAGHFVGERNHSFLSGLGEALNSNPLYRESGKVRASSSQVPGSDAMVFWNLKYADDPMNYYESWYWHSLDFDEQTAQGVCMHLGYPRLLKIIYRSAYNVTSKIKLDRDGNNLGLFYPPRKETTIFNRHDNKDILILDRVVCTR